MVPLTTPPVTDPPTPNDTIRPARGSDVHAYVPCLRPSMNNLSEETPPSVTVRSVDGLSNVTPGPGPNNGPPSSTATVTNTKSTTAAIPPSHCPESDYSGSVPSLANTSITPVYCLQQQTTPNITSAWRTSNVTKNPAFTSHSSLQTQTQTLAPTPALLSHLHLHHQETNHPTEPTEPHSLIILASIICSTMMFLPLTHLKSTRPRPVLFGLTTLLLLLLPLSLALPTNPTAVTSPFAPSGITAPSIPTTATLVDRITNNTNTTSSTPSLPTPSSPSAIPTTNSSNSNHALSSLPLAAYATIYAIIGIASLLALAALIYFAVAKCWPAWRRRKQAEREARAKLWWARRP